MPLLLLALAGCSSPAEPPREAPAREEPAAAAAETSSTEGTEGARPSTPPAPEATERPTNSSTSSAVSGATPPGSGTEAGAEAEPEPAPPSETDLAIDPVPGAVTVVQSVTQGRRSYHLFTYDGGAVARARIGQAPDGEARLEAIDEAIERCADENDDYSVFECYSAVVPDPHLAVQGICAAHGWGVALLEREGGRLVRRARRFLFALSCDDGSAAGVSPVLAVRDLDGDGKLEVNARVPLLLVREDGGMTGQTEGALAYLLDGDDLRVQLRVSTHLSSNVSDMAGTSTDCTAGWQLEDLNGDRHADVRVREQCTRTEVDELEGDSAPRTQRRTTDCLWTAASDTWACGEALGQWFFTGGTEGILGDDPTTLRLRVGARYEAVVEAYRRELEEGGDEEGGDEGEWEEGEEEEGEEEGEEPSAPAGAPACRHVVRAPNPPLHIRESPSSRSAIVGDLANGDEVDLVERQGRWARIERPARGWVWTAELGLRCGAR